MVNGRGRAARWAAVLAGGATACALLVAPSGQASPAPAATPAQDQVQAPVPDVDWQRCPRGYGAPRETRCAEIKVPLDYDEPDGRQATVMALKNPADVPSERLGSMFVNPGGPGGSATFFAIFAPTLLGTTVADRYDVIGIDPRGVAGRPGMACRSTAKFPRRFQEFPITRAQSYPTWRAGRIIRDACRDDPSLMVNHMSTADTARDMDLVRQALGEPLLNYYGISYGTQLGATYASMFPDHVGRFVVDGVLNPVAWATGSTNPVRLPFSTRLRSARGAYEAQVMALARCDAAGPRRCSFAGDAARKWRRLVRAAKDGRLVVGGDFKVSYQDLIGFTLGDLYSSDLRWWAGTLSWLHDETFGQKPPVGRTEAAQRLREVRRRAEAVRRAPYTSPVMPLAWRGRNVANAFHGVACADSRNPTGRQAWWQAGRRQDRQFPWFGSLWTWASAPCAGWPGAAKQDSWFGPFGGRTSSPILVVGNSYDPATPVQGARAFTRLFPGSRFVLADHWGHGALGGSCVTGIFDRYYADGSLPVEGKVCQPDHSPFPKGDLALGRSLTPGVR